MNLAYNVPLGTKEEFNTVIEIPKGSSQKYEYDTVLGVFKLKNELTMQYPFNYGFIPQTLAEDEDPLDCVIVNRNPILQGTVVPCRALGALDVTDRGKKDTKIIAFPLWGNENIKTVKDLDNYFLGQVSYFFGCYKGREEVEIEGWLGLNDAMDVIEQANENVVEMAKKIYESISNFYDEKTKDDQGTIGIQTDFDLGLEGLDDIGLN